MSSPTNLTDSLTRLRERTDKTDTTNSPSQPQPRRKSKQERRFATDLFMIFAYSLLGIALICQLTLIVWLDII